MSGPGEGRAERRARRLLVAYPWRVRAEQGDEIVGTVLDALPPGVDRLRWRDQVDLLRGGVRMRNQRRPPWPTVLVYNSAFRIGPQWINWVFDDLEHPQYVRSKRLRMAVWYGPMLVVGLILTRDLMLLPSMAPFLAFSFALVERDRDRKRARYGLAPGGRDPRMLWVTRRAKPVVPNLPIARFVVGLALPVAASAVLCMVATAHQNPLDGRGESVPAPPNVTSRMVGPGLAGTLVALVVLGLGLVAARRVARRRAVLGGPKDPLARPVASALVALGGAGATSLVGALIAMGLYVQDSGWQGALRAATIAPIALAVGLVGVALLVVGWVRGGPVGVWEVLPRAGPRDQSRPLIRAFVDPSRDRPVWEDDRPPAEAGPTSV